MAAPSVLSTFKVYCKEDLSDAWAEIDFWSADGFKHRVKLPVIAAWANPKTKKCIRGHFLAQVYNKEVREFFDGLNQFEDGLPVIDDQLTMLAHGIGDKRIVRYGFKGRSYPFTDNETGQNLSFFSCQQIMVKELLEYLKRWVPIAGMEMVDFSIVNKEWLESHGGIEIPDILKHSVPMWAADFGYMLRQLMKRKGLDTYDAEAGARFMLEEISAIVSGITQTNVVHND